MEKISVPQFRPLIAPLGYAIPVQWLACGGAGDADVDKPRNLAKSVAVE